MKGQMFSTISNTKIYKYKSSVSISFCGNSERDSVVATLVPGYLISHQLPLEYS